MKKISLIVLFMLSLNSLFSQEATPENTSPKEYAALQADEFVNHFGLSSEVREKIYSINLTCWSKIRDMQNSDQPEEVKKENRMYNMKQREQAMHRFLTPEQHDQLMKFQQESSYNQLNNF